MPDRSLQRLGGLGVGPLIRRLAGWVLGCLGVMSGGGMAGGAPITVQILGTGNANEATLTFSGETLASGPGNAYYGEFSFGRDVTRSFTLSTPGTVATITSTSALNPTGPLDAFIANGRIFGFGSLNAISIDPGSTITFPTGTFLFSDPAFHFDLLIPGSYTGGRLTGGGFDPATTLHLIIGDPSTFPPPPAATAPRSGPAPPAAPVLLTDAGAIHSLLTSGLQMPRMQRQTLQHAARTATRDLHGRLHRARATAGGPAAAFDSSLDGSTLRYLRFASDQRIDYRVALGLRDGVEKTYPGDSLARGDTLQASSPLAMLGGPLLLAPAAPTRAVIAAPAGSEVPDQAAAVSVDGAPSRFAAFAEYDYGFYDREATLQPTAGYEADASAASLGVEMLLRPWLRAGAAFGHLESETRPASGAGGVDLDGALLSGYLTAQRGGTHLDLLYSHGDFRHGMSRDTGLGSLARGDTDSRTHLLDLNLGHTLALSDRLVTGPLAGLAYTSGAIDGYTERGGGPANAVFPDDDFESLIARIGWQITHHAPTPLGRLTAQARLAWARECQPETDPVRAGLATSPYLLGSGSRWQRVGDFSATGEGAPPGSDWLEAGAGLRLSLNRDWSVALDYEGQYARDSAAAHFGTLRVEYQWGH